MEEFIAKKVILKFNQNLQIKISKNCDNMSVFIIFITSIASAIFERSGTRTSGPFTVDLRAARLALVKDFTFKMVYSRDCKFAVTSRILTFNLSAIKQGYLRCPFIKKKLLTLSRLEGVFSTPPPAVSSE